MNNKTRLLFLLDYLKTNSNPEHLINASDIAEVLQEKGYSMERKTVYSDVAALNEAGYNIELSNANGKVGYYYDSHLFDLAELRILADSIKSNSFLSEKKTGQLLDKLYSLTDIHDRELLKRTADYQHPKSGNEQILYNIDAIQNALIQHKAITFRYFDIDISARKNYRNHSYSVVPYALVLNQNRYYLICFDPKHDAFSHYRLDKMDSILLVDTDHNYRQFDVNRYVSSAFAMFAGQKQGVLLRCRNHLAEAIMDRFGEGAIITSREEEFFEVQVEVMISVMFYSWVFGYNGDVRIKAPDNIRKEFMDHCRKVMDEYER